MGECIVIASGKGGTGKSTITVNLGATIASMGKKVAIVDMDMGQRNLDMYLGVQNSVVYDFMDLAKGECRLRQALIRDRRFDSMYLIAASPDCNDGTLSAAEVNKVMNTLKEKFDYILVDAPAGIDSGFVLATTGADKALMVTEPNNSAIRDADKLDSRLREIGIDGRYFIINKVKMDLVLSGGCMSFNDISLALKSKVLGIIQYDDLITVSINRGIPAVLDKNSYIGENFVNIAKRIMSK